MPFEIALAEMVHCDRRIGASPLGVLGLLQIQGRVNHLVRLQGLSQTVRAVCELNLNAVVKSDHGHVAKIGSSLYNC